MTREACWFRFILIAKKKRKGCSSVLELVFLNFTISRYYFQKDIGRLEALTYFIPKCKTISTFLI
ncbi:hypothetical protein HanHA300_Chr05g0164511 [Helianthus annuus]|nr:hypothetical protein HanHA300_Chr05g0164511 [Helianthus annuus]KAJ0583601.1 hypothetical protein HanHA89_Chr05g0178541 [Helianthus annuus]